MFTEIENDLEFKDYYILKFNKNINNPELIESIKLLLNYITLSINIIEDINKQYKRLPFDINYADDSIDTLDVLDTIKYFCESYLNDPDESDTVIIGSYDLEDVKKVQKIIGVKYTTIIKKTVTINNNCLMPVSIPPSSNFIAKYLINRR